jgi:iron complex outermembrane receptor protein
LRATLFNINVTDEVHLDAFPTGIGNTNLPPSRRRGLEIDGRWPAFKSITLGAAYTYTDARFLEGVLPGGAFTQTNVVLAGKTAPLVPRHKANFAPDPRRKAGLMQSHLCWPLMDNDERRAGASIPAYTVVDLKLVHEKAWPIRRSHQSV